MSYSQFDYALGPENIASEPRESRLGRRDFGRMLVVDRRARIQHHSFVLDLASWLKPGDVLVLNDSKRIPGVVFGRTEFERAQVELRFVKLESDTQALCRIYPQHHLLKGTGIVFGSGARLSIVDTDIGPHRLFRVSSREHSLRNLLTSIGKPITSFFYSDYWTIDNYNTFYANEEGSVESPMAGLHLTPELLNSLRAHDVQIAFITLHVMGSWLPPLEDNEKSSMIPEPYHIPLEAATLINESRQNGNSVVACGSTVVRALESASDSDGIVHSGSAETTLFLQPGSVIRAVDHYFTNFHPSRSSLMILDASLCESDLLMDSYTVAREAGYLFLEFGDAVLYL